MPGYSVVRHGLLIVAIIVAAICYRPLVAVSVDARAPPGGGVLRRRVGREEVRHLPQVASGKQSVQIPAMVEAPVLERRYADGHGIHQNAKSPRRVPRAWFANMRAQ